DVCRATLRKSITIPCYGDACPLHSFPTRRSSDLIILAARNHGPVCWPRWRDPARARLSSMQQPAAASLTDTPQRPSPNENHLLINAYTTHPESPLLSVTRRIADSGCNLVDARLSTVGR